LRREGLYSSHLTEWRAARERGELEALAPKPRGPAPQAPDVRDHERELEALRRDLARMTARAERAEALVEVQKKSPPCWARPSTSRPVVEQLVARSPPSDPRPESAMDGFVA
jgi:hypothetical protein